MDRMMSMRALPSRHRGFSLIEVMIALGILSFGILGMMASQLTSMRFSENSRDHTLAMKLAEQQMEALLSMPPGDVLALVGSPNDPDNPIDPDPADGNAMQFWRRSIVVADSPEAGVISMTVEVDWINPLGATRTARIQSFKGGS